MSRKLALIIGNSDYEDSHLSQLVAPGADAEALAEILREPEIGCFDEVATLINETTTTIRREIAGFFEGKGRDDLLLLYFSGHGVRDDRGHLFLAVKDTEVYLLRGTAIRAAYITEEMDNSLSRRQVLILDCCHSGAFSQGMKAATGTSVGTATEFEGTGSGRAVLTATDSTQYAWEGDRVIGRAENSVFTKYLVQGLRSGEADANADGRITLDELYDYVSEQVVSETPKQTPKKWVYGQEGEIVIARNPHPVVKPVELPADLLQSIDDPRTWVREGAVQELDRILQGSNPGLSLSAYEALKHMADDDSRRVATMAKESLAAFPEAQHLREEAELEEQTRPSEQEEQDHQAHKPTEAIPGRREEAEPEELVLEIAKVESKATEQIAAKPEKYAATIKRAVAPGEFSWRPILLTTIGWAIGWLIFAFINTEAHLNPIERVVNFFIPGVIGGLTTGLVLQWTEPSMKWKHILLITVSWAFSGVTLAILFLFPGIDFVTALLTIVVVSGAVGGLATGLVLQRTDLSIHNKQITGITIGWAIGLFVAFLILGSTEASIIGSTISGAFCGAVGGFVMYWQLNQVRRQTETL
jgi:uncharacterized caspase-like protein